MIYKCKRNIYKCNVYMFINNLNKIMPFELTRATGYLIKINPGMRNHLSNFWSGEYKRLPKQYRLQPLYLVVTQKLIELNTPCSSNTELKRFYLGLTKHILPEGYLSYN